MNVHLVSGFLGSGKTTAIQQACRVLMENNSDAGVITNDQGIQLVDGYVFKSMGVPEKQVGGGCFCCNYSALDDNIGSMMREYNPSHIFAESVGTCTDIVATVMKPLQRYNNIERVTLTTIADARLLKMLKDNNDEFDQNVRYIYFKQLEEAAIIILNKIDLVTGQMITELLDYLHHHFSGRKIIVQDSRSIPNESRWLAHLLNTEDSTSLPSLQISYDRYAAGEAMLGYLDQQLTVRSHNMGAINATLYLVNHFVDLVRSSGAVIGHIKCWLNDRYKLSFTATTADDSHSVEPEKAETCDLIINARVQMEPDQLKNLMEQAITKTGSIYNISIDASGASYFRPGYPKPLHRIEE